MKVKDFCQCCSYDDYIWKIFVPNPDYNEHSDDIYHEVTVEDLSAAVHIFGEYEIDDDEGLFFESSSENPNTTMISIYLKKDAKDNEEKQIGN